MTLNHRYFLFLLTSLLVSLPAQATYRNRVALVPGIIRLNSPKQTDFELGIEAEHRLHRWIGIGAMDTYALSSPVTNIIGVPEIFIHPFDGNWFFSGASIFQIRSGTTTKLGARLGTRLLLPFPFLRIAPSFDYDFINGGHQYIFGVGVEFHTI